MSRKKINLTRLPVWQRYIISLTLVNIVVTFAYLIGKNQPIPTWIEVYLIPILSWTFIILFVSITISKFFQKSK